MGQLIELLCLADMDAAHLVHERSPCLCITLLLNGFLVLFLPHFRPLCKGSSQQDTRLSTQAETSVACGGFRSLSVHFAIEIVMER